MSFHTSAAQRQLLGKVNGRKRHIAVDTGERLLAVVVTLAGIQDRNAAHRLLTHLAAGSARSA
jgi:hypothetical protein